MRFNFFKKSFLLFLVTVLTIVSCDNEEISKPVTDKASEIVEGVCGPIHHVPNPVPEAGAKVKTLNANTSQSSDLSYDWTLLREEHINKMGLYSTWSFARDKFASKINLNTSDKPKSVCVNNFSLKSLSSAQNPNSSFNWKAEARFSPTSTEYNPNHYNAWRKIPEVAEVVFYNDSGNTQTIGNFNYPLWSSVSTTGTQWSVTKTANVTFGTKLDIAGMGGASFSIQLGISGMTSGSSTMAWSQNYYGLGIQVPKNKHIRFILKERWKPKTTIYQVPLEIRGKVGADYGKLVKGHYFWSINAASYFDQFSNGSQKYTVTVEDKYDRQVQVFYEIY